jgi:hypothetical protein
MVVSIVLILILGFGTFWFFQRGRKSKNILIKIVCFVICVPLGLLTLTGIISTFNPKSVNSTSSTSVSAPESIQEVTQEETPVQSQTPVEEVKQEVITNPRPTDKNQLAKWLIQEAGYISDPNPVVVDEGDLIYVTYNASEDVFWDERDLIRKAYVFLADTAPLVFSQPEFSQIQMYHIYYQQTTTSEDVYGNRRYRE